MNHRMRKTLIAASTMAALLLGGCGGDGDSSDAPLASGQGNAVPDSAGQSGDALVSYIQQLDPADETFEPSTISSTFAVPDDETGEPKPL